MKIAITWDAPLTNNDGTPCPVVEFYRVGFKNRAVDEWTETKPVVTTTVVLDDIGTDPGFYDFRVRACHSDELCSFPAKITLWCEDIDLSIRMDRDGWMRITWPLVDGRQYMIERADSKLSSWMPLVWGIRHADENDEGSAFVSPGVYRVRSLPG